MQLLWARQIDSTRCYRHILHQGASILWTQGASLLVALKLERLSNSLLTLKILASWRLIQHHPSSHHLRWHKMSGIRRRSHSLGLIRSYQLQSLLLTLVVLCNSRLRIKMVQQLTRLFSRQHSLLQLVRLILWLFRQIQEQRLEHIIWESRRVLLVNLAHKDKKTSQSLLQTPASHLSV